MRGMTIRATLGTPVLAGTPNGRVHLDSVLAYAAMRPIEHTLPPVRQHVQVIEIPGLQCLWRDDEGRPLWACSDLMPRGEWIQGNEYGHRRYPAHRAHLSKKPSANTAAGQFKEGRRQLRTTFATHWEAQAIGNPDQIRSLLATVSHIGGRASNYGRVLRWEVVEDDTVSAESVLARRSVPVAALEALGIKPGRVNPFCGWTPPYWYHAWFQPCTEPEPCSSPL